MLKPGGRLAVSTWHLSQACEVEAILHKMGGPSKPPGWITEPEVLKDLLTRADFTGVRVDLDAHTFRYADLEEYWQQARGTGLRRALDALDAVQTERVRQALADRVRPHQRADGLYLSATALLAVGTS